jgi:hypothetical protein
MMMNNMSQGLGSFNNMMPQNNMMQQNPYGQQMNPQMMGQQMQSPEMFSEQLMNPMMSQIQDPMQGLQPMAEPEGFGVYGQSLEGYAEGGEAVPRETEIMGQPHMLAYINPEEEMMLRQMGGSGMAGPGGVPSYPPSTQMGTGANVTGSSNSGNSNSGNSNRGEDRREREQQAARLANLQAQAAAAEKMVADQAAQQQADAIAEARREANVAPADATAETGIMSVVNDVKQGIKNFVSDVGMTYSGGLGSFSDLTDQTNYNAQYDKLVGAGYGQDEAIKYLDTTRAGQIAIRDDTLQIGQEISPERRAIMRDERLADEARLASAASTAVGTGIDTIPIQTGGPSGAGTVGANYEPTYGGFMPSSDFDSSTGEIFGGGNTYGAMTDGSQLIKILTPGGGVEYQILDPSGSSILTKFDNFQDAYQFANSKSGLNNLYLNSNRPPPVEQQIVEQTMPEVGSPNAVVPTQPVAETINTQVPAATVDPMTPVGGNFLLPGQQNYGPTPAAALNFNPNTYMQTPQNANVALSSMFQDSNPYTFEELLSQYKPAYSSFG